MRAARADDTYAGESVTSRALRVLGAFAPGHVELSLSDLSRRTDLPLTTVHRLVAELTAWGALERGDNGRYRVGLRLWEVAALAPRGIGLREAALPYLEDLYEVTHENVQLAVLDAVEVVYVERLCGREAVRVYTRPGLRFTPHATGVGLVLLAFAPPEVQERYLNSPLRTFTPRTITEPRRLRSVLADVRLRGYAVSDGQVTLDALSVAAPVRDSAGDVIAAVSVVVHAEGAAPVTLSGAVVAAAEGISRALRGTPGARR